MANQVQVISKEYYKDGFTTIDNFELTEQHFVKLLEDEERMQIITNIIDNYSTSKILCLTSFEKSIKILYNKLISCNGIVNNIGICSADYDYTSLHNNIVIVTSCRDLLKDYIFDIIIICTPCTFGTAFLKNIVRKDLTIIDIIDKNNTKCETMWESRQNTYEQNFFSIIKSGNKFQTMINDVNYYIINPIAKNYVCFENYISYDAVNDFCTFMFNHKVWNKTDSIIFNTQKKSYVVDTKWHNISFTKNFYNANHSKLNNLDH